MKTKTKIILGLGIGLILLGCIAVAGFAGAAMYFFSKIETPERMEKTKKAKADGIEFAKNVDQNGCMQKGFSLKPSEDSFDISNVTFVKECLNASRPTPNFCDGVPFIFDRKWFDAQCKLAGHETDACTAAFIAKRDYCQLDGKK